MSRRLFFNSRGEGKTLVELDLAMNRGGEPLRMGSRTSGDRERHHSPHRRNRSPRKERQQRGNSLCSRSETSGPPCPLSFLVFIGNKPMTEVDSIIHDPNVAVEFVRQIFPPEVQQSMVSRPDFEVFQEGVHRAVKGLYTSYEIGMHLHAAQQEIEQKDELIQNLEARVEKAERELKKAKTAETQSVGQVNPIVDKRVTQRLLNHAIADQDTMSMFAREAIRTKAYNEGFFDRQKIGIEKTKEKLAEEVCRCENHGFKHGWTKALQGASVNSASPLY